MKHLLSILLICSITLTQELTVDGNLNVTGNIQNQTIDSLQQVIAELQMEIDNLFSSNQSYTKVITINNIYLTPGSNDFGYPATSGSNGYIF